MKELVKFRREIDQIDYQILKLVKKRFQLISKMVKFKKKNQIKLRNPQREKFVIKDRIKKSREMGINNARLTKKLFKLLIKKSFFCLSV